jgi:hypothetical protein
MRGDSFAAYTIFYDMRGFTSTCARETKFMWTHEMYIWHLPLDLLRIFWQKFVELNDYSACPTSYFSRLRDRL